MRQYSGMSPGKSSRLVDEIVRVIDEFEQGAIDVERLQSALEACAAALDNSSTDVLDELRRLEADLETTCSRCLLEIKPTQLVFALVN
jgi:hypothetical protein